MIYRCSGDCCHPETIEQITLSRRTVTARKAHTCTRCRRPIEPGQRYRRVAELVDRVFTLSKLHEMCPGDSPVGWA